MNHSSHIHTHAIVAGIFLSGNFGCDCVNKIDIRCEPRSINTCHRSFESIASQSEFLLGEHQNSSLKSFNHKHSCHSLKFAYHQTSRISSHWILTAKKLTDKELILKFKAIGVIH